MSVATELVHDDSEKCLLYEIGNLRKNKSHLESSLEKCKDQV